MGSTPLWGRLRICCLVACGVSALSGCGTPVQDEVGYLSVWRGPHPHLTEQDFRDLWIWHLKSVAPDVTATKVGDFGVHLTREPDLDHTVSVAQPWVTYIYDGGLYDVLRWSAHAALTNPGQMDLSRPEDWPE